MTIGSPKVRVPTTPVKKGEMVNIKTMIQHPMESGLRKDKESGESVRRIPHLPAGAGCLGSVGTRG
ncbi:MAG: thiosulfate oxidation carrier complex protein SoxZ, partial [Magnetococcales bacterium]|nr:thiosulfate oxidation carrier complex protein SoxZ [Magnetococcales bacterium]